MECKATRSPQEQWETVAGNRNLKKHPYTLYLSSILDLYNGEIVAYNIIDKQDTSFVLDTLNRLPNQRNDVTQ